MTQKQNIFLAVNSKTILVIAIIAAGFFGFNLAAADAPSVSSDCNMTVMWEIQNSDGSYSQAGASAAIGSQALAVVQYNNCVLNPNPNNHVVNPQVQVMLNGQASGDPIGLGGPITSNPEKRYTTVTLSAAGAYTFVGRAWNDNYTNSKSQPSTSLQAGAGGTKAASGVNGGNLTSGSPCDINNDMCGAHLSCDASQNPTKCISASTQGAKCDPNNNLCDAENNLDCVVSSDGVTYTCQSTNSTKVPASAAASTPASSAPAPANCTGANPDPKNCLFNPLITSSLTDMVLLIMRGFLYIVGLWAVTFIIIGGFRMIMAQGNEESYLAARKTIIWAVLGLAVALLSFSIVAIVQSFIGAKAPVVNTSQNSSEQRYV